MIGFYTQTLCGCTSTWNPKARPRDVAQMYSEFSTKQRNRWALKLGLGWGRGSGKTSMLKAVLNDLNSEKKEKLQHNNSYKIKTIPSFFETWKYENSDSAIGLVNLIIKAQSGNKEAESQKMINNILNLAADALSQKYLGKRLDDVKKVFDIHSEGQAPAR